MAQTVRHQLLIALAAGIVLFTNLGVPALWDEDEPKNAECAREMLARGDWVVPTFNEELRTDKPILLYWLMMPAYQVFGVTEFAARIWSAMFGLGTALATYHLGRLLFTAEVGLWAGLILGTALMFDAVSRAATPDATLIICTTLALLAFVQGVAAHRRRAAARGEEIESICLPDRWHSLALMYVAMGFAVLAKGPVGVALPGGVVGLFVLCMRRGGGDARLEVVCGAPSPRPYPGGRGRVSIVVQRVFAMVRPVVRAFAPVRVAEAAWSLRPITGVLIVSLIALPWYVAVGIETEGRWLAGFLGNHNLGRFMRPMEGHRGPIFFYLPAILAGFFPWSLFLPVSVVQAVKQVRQRAPWHWGYVFALCWAGLYIGFFSLARTKLPNYVLPAYPALALLTSALLVRWQKQPDLINRWIPRLSLGILAVAGVGILIGFGVAAHLLLPGDEVIGLVGLIPLTGAAIAAWYWRRGSSVRVVQCYGVMAVLLATAILGFAAPRISRSQNSPVMAELARQASPQGRRIATFEYYAPSLIFYAQQRVPECRNQAEVRELFQGTQPAFLVTRPDHLKKLAAAIPPDVSVLARQRRFLRSGELVLLGRTAAVANHPNPKPPRR